jgi:hypothetical protein
MRTRCESWKTKIIDPPDLSTWSFTADTRPVRVLLALDSPAVYDASSAVAENCAWRAAPCVSVIGDLR